MVLLSSLSRWRLRRPPPPPPPRLRRPVLFLAPTLLDLRPGFVCPVPPPPLALEGRRFARGSRRLPFVAMGTAKFTAVSAAAERGPQARVASANAWHETTSMTAIEGGGDVIIGESPGSST